MAVIPLARNLLILNFVCEAANEMLLHFNAPQTDNWPHDVASGCCGATEGQRGGGVLLGSPGKLIFVRFLRFTFVWPKTICCCRCQLDSGALRPPFLSPLLPLDNPFPWSRRPLSRLWAPGHFSPGTYLHCLAIFKQFQLGCLTWLALRRLPALFWGGCIGGWAGSGDWRLVSDCC